MHDRVPSLSVPARARVDGVEECFAVINGLRWRYQHAGSGPPLLLIHGFMAYSFSWRMVIKALAEHYTVYAMDLPGTGFSQRNALLPGTLASDAEHLLQFMNHLGLKECDIIGTSRGGGATIALCALLAQKGQLYRIHRIILSAPINPWSRYENARVHFLETPLGCFYVVHMASRLSIILKRYFLQLYYNRATIPADSFAGYQTGLAAAGSFQHLWKIARSWFADLNHIENCIPLAQSLPALILWGEHDRAVRPASAYEIHRRWKNSVVVMMPNIGHMPYEEAPEEFTRIALDFLLRNIPPISHDESQLALATAHQGPATA